MKHKILAESDPAALSLLDFKTKEKHRPFKAMLCEEQSRTIYLARLSASKLEALNHDK